MSVIDEKQEAVARIRMAVDNDNLARLNLDTIDDDDDMDELRTIDANVDSRHWQLGSLEGKKSNLRVMSAELGREHKEYRRLDENVRDFITLHMPEEAMRYEDDIYVSLFRVNQLPETIYLVMLQAQRYKCVSLNYQSRVDWTEMKDILRCNPNFHGGPRFDCVIIHDDAPGITCARLQCLIRCWLPAGKVLDLALVRRFTCSKWKPRTLWKGCRILDEDEGSESLTIVSMDYLLRGALMCPVSELEGEKAHYFVDTVDPDIFLWENY
jgi:hypothetical protein